MEADMRHSAIWITRNRAGSICSVAAEKPKDLVDSHGNTWVKYAPLYTGGERADESILCFEAVARKILLEDHPYVGVWTDGVGFNSDNGHSPMMPGIAACAMRLTPEKKYRVTVEECD